MLRREVTVLKWEASVLKWVIMGGNCVEVCSSGVDMCTNLPRHSGEIIQWLGMKRLR